MSQLKQASVLTREVKISLILVPGYASMPDIKLTRTDTTHDLSQKAEKLNLFLIFGTCLEHNNEKTARIIKIYIYPTGLRAGLLPGPTYERSRGKVEKR